MPSGGTPGHVDVNLPKPHGGTELVDARGRKYLTAPERARFLEAVGRHPKPTTQTLARTLAMTGCRVSEALGLRACDVDLETNEVRISTLKRRREHWRAVPVTASSHTASRGTYGSPRVHRDLVDDGVAVGRHRVARLMRQEGLRSKRRRRYRVTTHSDHRHPVAANVLERDFTADAENCKWAADITYVWTRCGWLYLAVVLDLYSRRVVGWAMSNRIKQGPRSSSSSRCSTIGNVATRPSATRHQQASSGWHGQLNQPVHRTRGRPVFPAWFRAGG